MENNYVTVSTAIKLDISRAEHFIEKRIKESFSKWSNTFNIAVSLNEESFNDLINNTNVKSRAYFIRVKFYIKVLDGGILGSDGSLYHYVNRIQIPNFSNDDEFIKSVDVAIKDFIKHIKKDKVNIEKVIKKYLESIDSIK